METINSATSIRVPWNKGKLVGQKAPFKLKEIWAIRVRLQMAGACRELALFNLAVDSKLRACDLVQLRVRDVCHGQSMASRALILQQKTQRPVQFEITEPTRVAVSAWIKKSALNSEDFLFPSRIQESPHLSTRQYARIVDSWVQLLGLDTTSYGTHALRRTKATLIYRRTKNLRAVQLLLGHSKLESTVSIVSGGRNVRGSAVPQGSRRVFQESPRHSQSSLGRGSHLDAPSDGNGGPPGKAQCDTV